MAGEMISKRLHDELALAYQKAYDELLNASKDRICKLIGDVKYEQDEKLSWRKTVGKVAAERDAALVEIVLLKATIIALEAEVRLLEAEVRQ